MTDALVPVVEPPVVNQGRLHRIAGDIDHPAVAGDEPVGQLRSPELDVPGHSLLLDDGTCRRRPRLVRRRRRSFPSSRAASPGPDLSGRSRRWRRPALGRSLVGERGVVGEPEQQVARHVERLGGGGLAEPSRTCRARPSRSPPRVLMVAGGELLLGDGAHERGPAGDALRAMATGCRVRRLSAVCHRLVGRLFRLNRRFPFRRGYQRGAPLSNSP